MKFIKKFMGNNTHPTYRFDFEEIDPQDITRVVKESLLRGDSVSVCIPPSNDCLKVVSELSIALEFEGVKTTNLVDAAVMDSPYVVVDTISNFMSVAMMLMTSGYRDASILRLVDSVKVDLGCQGFLSSLQTESAYPLRSPVSNNEKHIKTLQALMAFMHKHHLESGCGSFDSFFLKLLSSNIIKDNVAMKALAYRVFSGYTENLKLEIGKDYLIGEGRVFWVSEGDKIASKRNHQDSFVHGAAALLNGAKLEQDGDGSVNIRVHPMSFFSRGPVFVCQSAINPAKKQSLNFEVVDSKKVQNEYMNQFFLKHKGTKVNIVVSSKEMHDALSGLPDDGFHVMSHEYYIIHKQGNCEPTVMMEMPNNYYIWLRVAEASSRPDSFLVLLSKHDARLTESDAVVWAGVALSLMASVKKSFAPVEKFWRRIWDKDSRTSLSKESYGLRISDLKFNKLVTAHAEISYCEPDDAMKKLKLNKIYSQLNLKENTKPIIFQLFMVLLCEKLLNLNEKRLMFPFSEVLSGGANEMLIEEHLFWEEVI